MWEAIVTKLENMSAYSMIFLLTHFPPPFSRVIIRVSLYDTTCEKILNGSIGCCVCPVTSENKKILSSNQWRFFFFFFF